MQKCGKYHCENADIGSIDFQIDKCNNSDNFSISNNWFNFNINGNNEVIIKGTLNKESKNNQNFTKGEHILVYGENKNANISNGIELILKNGKSISASILSTGVQAIGAYGIADHAIIASGGVQTVNSNAIAKNTIVNNSGILQICSGGSASNISVNSNGHVKVLSGGIVDKITIEKNGHLSFYNNTTILSGYNKVNNTDFSVKNNITSNVYVNCSFTDISKMQWNNTIIDGGYLQISSNNATNITITNSGYLAGLENSVFKDISATNGDIAGATTCSAYNINIYSGGFLGGNGQYHKVNIYSGGSAKFD